MWELGEEDLTPTPDVIQGVEEKEEVPQLARPLPHLLLSVLARGTFCPCAGTPATAGFLARVGKNLFWPPSLFSTGKICVTVQQPRAVGWQQHTECFEACAEWCWVTAPGRIAAQ